MNHSPGPWTWQDEMLVDRDGKGVEFEAQAKPMICLIPTMREMLLRLELKGEYGCPECARGADGGAHESDCSFAALLEKLR